MLVHQMPSSLLSQELYPEPCVHLYLMPLADQACSGFVVAEKVGLPVPKRPRLEAEKGNSPRDDTDRLDMNPATMRVSCVVADRDVQPANLH